MKQTIRRAPMLVVGLVLLVTAASPASASQAKQIKVFFLNMGVQAPAMGRVLFVSNPAQNFFSISVARMTPGTYDVALDGALVDTLRVNSKGKGVLLHRSILNPKRGPFIPLPYDPRGGQITIESNGEALLEGDVPETPEENQQKVEIESNLTNLGVVSGEAKANFEASFGRMQFEVEIENAPPGTYDLLVDGVNVGKITVGVDGDGRIEFDSMPSVGSDDDQGDNEGTLDLLLTFDPRGKNVEIQQNGVDSFSGIFPLTGGAEEDEGGDD